MEWVETTGRTLEEAKEVALDQLGVDEQDAEFEIVEEAKSGLFGRLRTEARVRARVRPTTPPPKADRRDRRRRGPSSGEDATSEDAPSRAASSIANATDPRSADARPGDAREATPRRRPSAPSSEPRSPARTPSAPTARGATMEEPIDLEATSDALRVFLEGLLVAFDLEATVTVREVDDGVLEASIDGEELGLLVGPKGQTVDALQDLAGSAVPHDGSTRLRVDVAGYRERRREALTRFAAGVAQEVIAADRATSLEPMSAADRKVVHDAVNDIDGVRTTSEGEEPRRRVVVHPEH
jgi:spoIIIJ-associated protein